MAKRIASIEELLHAKDEFSGEIGEDTQSEDFDEAENSELLALYTDSGFYVPSPSFKIEPL